MTKVLRTILERVAVGFFAGGVGALLEVVAREIWSDHNGSAVVVPWTGVVIGFLLGAVFKNTTVTGRSKSLISGLLVGVAIGVLAGWGWARAEYLADRQQLVADRIPLEFIDGHKQGLFKGNYEAIGLQFGVPLGIMAGLASGLGWVCRNRWSRAIPIATAATVCVLVVGVLWMNRRLERLSRNNRSDVRVQWDSRTDRRKRWEKSRAAGAREIDSGNDRNPAER
ncbi:MAG: hypothetical protein NT069_25525 [Planctomycetota bacterium]|nr:hypothetical protein [Planctomycetota bacterium]